MSEITKEKRKQKPKAGRVVRLAPDVAKLLETLRMKDETVAETFRRLLLSVSGFVLPSDLHETIEDARGAAILRKVKTRAKRAERPIPVREVG